MSITAPTAPTNPTLPAADGATAPGRWLRREDPRLVSGRGRFIHNLAAQAHHHAVFVRSPHAHARLLAIDCAAARADPAVIGVLTSADLPPEILARFRVPPFNPLVKAVQAPAHPLLAIDRVDAIGQPVALVVARTRAAAHQAAAAVWVDYEPLSAVADTDHDAPESFRLRIEHGPEPDPAAIAQRVRMQQQQPRVCAAPLEPRAAIAHWHADTGTMTAWIGTQAPSRARDDIADLLGLARSAVTVITPDVGGAFGSKASIYPEDLVVCLAARHFATAIQWLSTRSEEFLSAFHGRGGRLEGELAVGHAGELLELRARVGFPLGAWLPFSAVVPTRNATRILPGPYRVDAVRIDGRAVLSNAAPVNIYRGAGRPEAALLMEALMDAAARARGEDPIAFRRRALVPAGAMPWRTPTGECLDSGDYAALLDRACVRFDYDRERQQQRERQARGERIGIGIALYVEPCGQGWESARVTLAADGRILVASGSSAQGQGHETTFARIAAEALGCDPARVEVLQGDTTACPAGVGALASRSIAIGGSAIATAAAAARGRRDAGEALPIVEDVVYTADGEAWSAGCVLVRMAIATDTGQPRIERLVWVDDAGRIISPELAEGQLIGGLAQGIGQAMMERIVYDETGQLLTGSLLDYALPRATDIPVVELDSLQSPSPMNRLGAKGVGEAGCIGVPAALRSAAIDALAGDGVTDLDFPLTAERLWRALHRLPDDPRADDDDTDGPHGAPR